MPAGSVAIKFTQGARHLPRTLLKHPLAALVCPNRTTARQGRRKREAMRFFRFLAPSFLLLTGITCPVSLTRAAETPATTAVPAVCTSLTLHLEPGVRRPDGSLDPNAKPTPPNMPLDPVVAQAPLYPGAAHTVEPLKNPDYAPILTAYLKTVAAEYSVPAGVGTAVKWYTNSFATCGYQLYSRSESSGPRGSSVGIRFRSPTTPNMWIALSLQKGSAGNSLLLYYAYAVTLPPRPGASIIPLNQKSMKVTYVFPGGHQYWGMTVTDRGSILAIINPLDSLQTVDDIAHTCFSADHGQATFVFTSTQGKRTTVLVLPGCEDLRVDRYPLLVDDNHGVWSAAGYVAYQYCLGHRCKKTKFKG